MDNEQEEAPLKKDKEPASVISRNFTRKQDLKPIQSAHITVDDRGDTMTGGVSVRAIEDFRDRAKTRIRHHQIQTVTPSGVSIPSMDKVWQDMDAIWKDVPIAFKDAQMSLRNAPFFKQAVERKIRKPSPK